MAAEEIIAELRRGRPAGRAVAVGVRFRAAGQEIRRVEAAGAKVLHLDIMDGHFVPNLSFGIPVVEAVRRSTDLPLDVHLMISEPGRYVKRFREAGADLLTIHIEVGDRSAAAAGGNSPLGAVAGHFAQSADAGRGRRAVASTSATSCW